MFCRNKKKCFFIFISLCIFWGCLSIHLFREDKFTDASLSKILAKIPEDDQLILEDFFQDLIMRSSFGYVLFGNKPISEMCYVNPMSNDCYIEFRVAPENLKLQKGIECWRKYCKLFPSKNYLFNFFGDPSADDYIEVALVNKKKFIEVIQENLTKFQSVFGPNTTAEKFLVKFATEQDFWENHFDHEMLGILYGYGETNSYIFQRRTDINPQLRGGRFTLKKRPKIPRQGYSTIEEEYTDLLAKFRVLQDDHLLDRGYMGIPHFLAILDSEETIRIKNDLILQRKKMIKIFKDGNFFKKSMQQYTGIDSKH